MIAPKQAEHESMVLDFTSSDHNVVIWELAEISVIERKTIRVVNKRLAQRVSLQALYCSSNAVDFLSALEFAHQEAGELAYIELNPRRIERKLFPMLVSNDGSFSNRVTCKYWRDIIQENERMRYSEQSKEAFKWLKDIYKYNQFEKRDGSIVDKVIDGDEIIKDEKSVNALLIGHLRSIQRDPSHYLYDENSPTPFPVMSTPSMEEMSEILSIITTNKALTADFVSDSILEGQHWERTCMVLKDLWSGLEINNTHFRCRLIALNKKHPSVPRKDQFRPIIITSLLFKILEARLVKPLRKYMIERLHISQTGFVPGMDVNVNISRLLVDLMGHREKGVRSFLLFLDFSSAYNTVLHDKLFQMLKDKNILAANEVQLLQALYSRMTIELREEKFQSNVGVAQGSLISPYLFNIYAEGLLESLESEDWRARDLYGFADDHLVRNSSLPQLEKAIEIVEKWCIEFNIKLNPAKSGILEVMPKHRGSCLRVGSFFKGIPVVDRYKYLGVWLDQKLSPRAHLAYLFGSKDDGKTRKGKVNFLASTLSPCYRNISFDYGLNLWITFVRPLFLPLTALGLITTSSEREMIQAKMRVSLKKFLKLPKTFRTEVLSQVYPIDFAKWIKIERDNSKTK